MFLLNYIFSLTEMFWKTTVLKKFLKNIQKYLSRCPFKKRYRLPVEIFFWEFLEISKNFGKIIRKPFSANVPLLYPLKTSENQRFADVFKEYRSKTLIKI